MNEREGKRTIVGGRPRGRGPGGAGVPRGIEVLVKKASIDADFCQLLLAQRAAAANEIGLDLSPSEAAILNAVPEAQLRAMIDHTTVPDAQRRAFLGTLGAAMLAAVVAGCTPPTPTETPVAPAGIRPEQETATPTLMVVEKGIRPEEGPTHTPTPGATPTSTETPSPEALSTPAPADAGSQLEPKEEPPAPVVRGIRPDRP